MSSPPPPLPPPQQAQGNSDYINKIYSLFTDDVKKFMKETLALSGPHDNHHDFKTNRDELLDELKEKFMCFPTNKFPWTASDDEFLKYLGITRKPPSENDKAVYEFEVDTELEPNSKQKKIQETIDANYNFYYYDENTSKDPITQLIEALGGVPNDNNHTYDLVVDTQYYFLRNLIKQGLSKKFNFLENEATVFDPANKMRPIKGTKGGEYLSFKDDEDSDITGNDDKKLPKIKFRAEEGFQIIPEIKEVADMVEDSKKHCEYTTDTNNHNILFSSKLPISVFTNGIEEKYYWEPATNKKEPGNVIKEAYAIVDNETQGKIPYLIPHTFTKITADTMGVVQFKKKSNAVMQCIENLRTALNPSKQAKEIIKYHLSKFGRAHERTPIHYLMKRLGDALQALICYIENPDEDITGDKLLKWFVTLDTPCFGISLLYKTPVVIFCNNVTGYNEDLNKNFKNITVAVRIDLLTDEAKRQAAEAAAAAADAAAAAADAATAEKKIALNTIKAELKAKINNITTIAKDGPFGPLSLPGQQLYALNYIIDNKIDFSTFEKEKKDLMEMVEGLNDPTKAPFLEKAINTVIKKHEAEEKRKNQRQNAINRLRDKMSNWPSDNKMSNWPSDNEMATRIGGSMNPLNMMFKRKLVKLKIIEPMKVGRRTIWKFSNLETNEWYQNNIGRLKNTIWHDLLKNPMVVVEREGGGKNYEGGANSVISTIDMYKKITENLLFLQQSLYKYLLKFPDGDKQKEYIKFMSSRDEKINEIIRFIKKKVEDEEFEKTLDQYDIAEATLLLLTLTGGDEYKPEREQASEDSKPIDIEDDTMEQGEQALPSHEEQMKNLDEKEEEEDERFITNIWLFKRLFVLDELHSTEMFNKIEEKIIEKTKESYIKNAAIDAVQRRLDGKPPQAKLEKAIPTHTPQVTELKVDAGTCYWINTIDLYVNDLDNYTVDEETGEKFEDKFNEILDIIENKILKKEGCLEREGGKRRKKKKKIKKSKNTKKNKKKKPKKKIRRSMKRSKIMKNLVK